MTRRDWEQKMVPDVAERIAHALGQYGDLSWEELKDTLEDGLGEKGMRFATQALAWLRNPCCPLVEEEDGRYRLSELGERAVRNSASVSFARGIGQLLVDLLTVDPTDDVLEQWTSLDHLIVLHMLWHRAPKLRSVDEALKDQVDAWMARQEGKPSLLHGEWIVRGEEKSQADEVLGSLWVLPPKRVKDRKAWAEDRAYGACLQAIIAYEMAQDKDRVDEIEAQWGVSLRDVEWWLQGVDKRLCWLCELVDIITVANHLSQELKAGIDRVGRVMDLLVAMQGKASHVHVLLMKGAAA